MIFAKTARRDLWATRILAGGQGSLVRASLLLVRCLCFNGMTFKYLTSRKEQLISIRIKTFKKIEMFQLEEIRIFQPQWNHSEGQEPPQNAGSTILGFLCLTYALGFPPLRFICAIANGSTASFLHLSNIPFVRSSVDRPLSCFHTLSIVNSAAVNWKACHPEINQTEKTKYSISLQKSNP